MAHNNEEFVLKKELKFGNCSLFKVEQNKQRKRVKFLNFEIYSFEDNFEYRTQNILGEFITTRTNKSFIKEEKEINIFGFPVAKRVFKNDVFNHYVFGKVVNSTCLKTLISEKIFEKVTKNFDDAYILNSNSGEIFLFFAYFAKEFLAKNDSKAPLFVAIDKYHVDIINLYFPEFECVHIKDLKVATYSDFWEYENRRFYVLFSKKHFDQMEYAIKNDSIGSVHYFTKIQETLGMTTYSKNSVVEVDSIMEEALQKVKFAGLNLDKFVIVAPEAKSFSELPLEFWKKVVDNLKLRGYSVYLNTKKRNLKIDGCIDEKLTFEEVYYVAQKAKAIISLRSGLSEFLLPTQTPNITIYTPFQHLKNSSFETEKLIPSFSMFKIPEVNNQKIKEINSQKYFNIDELLCATMSALDDFVQQ